MSLHVGGRSAADVLKGLCTHTPCIIVIFCNIVCRSNVVSSVVMYSNCTFIFLISWTVLRSQRMSVDTSANEVASCPRSAADEWGAEADDWGCDAEEGDYESSDCSAVSNCSPRVSPDGDQHQSTAEEIESRLEHISIGGNSNNTEVEVPSVSVEVGRNCLGNNVMIASAVEADLVLQSCYLYVIDEPLIEDDLKHEQQLLKQYAQREGLDVSTLDEGIYSLCRSYLLLAASR